MRLRVLLVSALVVVLAALAAGGWAALAGDDALEDLKPPTPATETGRAQHFDVRRVVTGLNRPTWVGHAPGDEGALWVLEQPGRVLRIQGGERRVLLDLSGEIRTGAEQGLLGIAFHPDFASDRRLYLHWSDRAGDTRVAELRVRRDGTIVDRPRRELLHVDQPEENHNGGHLAFGPDGRLYLGLGDGGGAFDPRRTAQDPEQRLGKLLATPVDGPPQWKAVLTGLRNPWRFHFDVGMNEVWIGDVGQDEVEEVDRVPLELDEPPKNLGWSAFEGTRRMEGRELEPGGDIVWPVAVYDHDAGCSITGGPIYGGTELAPLSRRYVYGDFCSGAIWTLRPAAAGEVEDVRREKAIVPQLTHIGVDDRGELVFASAGGALYRAVAPGS
jgi:glucose/arabinose dehydrogenase